ncbi:hypothetical protein CIMG_07562 [Paecilomyces variotii No. 5]|uniref:Nucleolar protein 12-domain-containing protein n=1 Tax=Byssochlamys spectabilis (strain No. 5 / NBRC 109023) TaxID=1356009 RepID=V5FBK2_BYSSN|nr:hypothetical protein CIMG_07562 [Paecilomyces variotii No. 5]
MGPLSKKRKLAAAVEEVTFDDAARHEFLTGFHKRKLQRAKHAQELAEKRAREERREQRKMLREERNAEFQRIVEENGKALRKFRGGSDSQSEEESDSNDEEWEGFEEPPAVDYEAEYIDEDKYTTVTVEEMDASKEGLYKAEKDESDESSSRKGDTVQPTPKSNSATKKAKKAGDDKPKKKKKKFRYESKEERKLARTKQKMSNKRKADARRER